MESDLNLGGDTRRRTFRQLFRVLQQPIALLILLQLLLGFLALLPGYYDKLTSSCVELECGGFLQPIPSLEPLSTSGGLSPSGYALILLTIHAAFALISLSCAFVVAFHGRQEPLTWLSALLLGSFGTSFPPLLGISAEGQAGWELAARAVAFMGWIAFFPVAWLLVIPIRKRRSAENRQQAKWGAYGLTVGFVSYGAFRLTADGELLRSPILYLWANGLMHLFVLVAPLSLTLAVLGRKLWSIDLVVSRTIVATGVAACAIALHGAVFLAADKALPGERGWLVSFLAAAAVAVAYAPLRTGLRRVVYRWFKGKQEDPYRMLAELRALLMKPLPPESMLDALLLFIRESLRLPFAEISVEVNGHDRIVAADPEARTEGECRSYPIVHRGKEVGTLRIVSRPGDHLSAGDARLLDVLLGHAGPIVDNYLMNQGLQLLADDLQTSRERIVFAREEERRTLRKNLHDELAPRLAALGLNASAAELYVNKEPEIAKALLTELRQVIRSTVEDIRTLVHDMRPASLDEWGLVGAIRQRIRELAGPSEYRDSPGMSGKDLSIKLHAPQQMPRLPAAVEVAVYWIATEALSNAVRHAQATECTVRIAMNTPRQLTLEVVDNGIGLGERTGSASKGGIGIESMKERAVELGGKCMIESLIQGGTRISASIPVISERRTTP